MRLRTLISLALAFGLRASAANAIPSLQLGPGTGDWTYNAATQTWETADNPLNLLATANATTGNGDYAWDDNTNTTRYAYLVVSAVPKTTETEPPSLFDITVENDGGVLSLNTSGNGAPPLSDPNDLSPHGIFDTYFEIYEFQFDGSVVTISDTQPGETGTGDGYQEFFDITINSLAESVEQVHFDLFTIEGGGQLTSTSMVEAFAPFSHDAQAIPEPGAIGVFSLGLLVAGGMIRRFGRRED
jgi:hypothetical protein